ncbi:ComF family protein [Alteromonas pelagimontana]|uniref:ComF family protein n=1 Tax=Alteromonas pelagimontana TaxID=1858656 RepID=A0A6M4MCP4_9ALTE|nr:ComF family protein [Alteromonas pelagimontana]QJR80849.1 ComF family protein [Alteromonas pelagimontana]
MRDFNCIPNYACLLCNQFSNIPICEYCKNDTLFFNAMDYPANLLHRPDIAKGVRHTAFHILRACGAFGWPFDTLIHKLKFNGNILSAKVLAQWFCENCIDSATPLPECLLPVPIHFARYFKRRYNQSVALADFISRDLGIPVRTQWSQRVAGQAQHQLNRAERLLNLRKAFKVLPIKSYGRVAIIDDVVTTGCTVDVLCRQLRQQQPGIQIEVWAMAVTPSPQQRRLAV